MMLRSFRTLCAVLAVLGAAAPALAQSPQGQIINLRNADISALIDQVSATTGYTFVVGPEVRGEVTVVSQIPLSPEEVFEVFLSTLRVHGFSAVRIDTGVYRIVPQDAAAGDPGAGGFNASGDSFSTVVLRLNNVGAQEAAQSIMPMLGPQGAVTANPQSNAVIIVDYASNLQRLRSVVAELDRDRSEIVSVPVVNMSAREMADIITGLNAGPTGATGAVSAVPVRSGNTVVLRGEPDTVARMAGLIGDLDRTSLRQDTVRVVRLQNADAEELAPVLENLLGALTQPGEGAEGAPAVPGITGGPSITVYASTNSLVLSAPPETLNEMERVIGELDVRRPQVLVEAIIVEVSDTVARDLGVQFLLAGSRDSSIPFAATSYSGSAPSLLALAGALIDDERVGGGEDGFLGDTAAASALGSRGALIGVGGQNSSGALFGAILNAVQADQDSNVLSTPSITTLDNQEALINVGQEIPISTGEVLSASNNNPFRTIERKDVGVRLAVRPQIGDGDTIKLFISQEASSVLGPVSVSSGELVTSKRQIETTVLADNSEIIVLGGLIQDDEQEQEEKVPVLGDVPLLGAAFRNTSRSRARTNLMVFIRPTILRDAATAQAATATRLDYMRAEQFAAQGNVTDEISMDRVFRDAMGGVNYPDAAPAPAPSAPVQAAPLPPAEQ